MDNGATGASVAYKTYEKVDKELEFKREVIPTANGGNYMRLETERLVINLFDGRAEKKEGAKAYLKYNAKITDKRNGYIFSFPVRELEESKDIIAGQKSAISGHKCILHDYKKATATTPEKTFETLSIPMDIHDEVMAVIGVVNKEVNERIAAASAE